MNEALNLIEAHISDLDALIKLGTHNETQKSNVDMWQFARNELVLVRDAILNISEESEMRGVKHE